MSDFILFAIVIFSTLLLQGLGKISNGILNEWTKRVLNMPIYKSVKLTTSHSLVMFFCLLLIGKILCFSAYICLNRIVTTHLCEFCFPLSIE